MKAYWIRSARGFSIDSAWEVAFPSIERRSVDGLHG